MTALRYKYFLTLLAFIWLLSCSQKQDQGGAKEISAAGILGNPEMRAISYGGYRHMSRDTQPTLDELKADMRILHAADIRLLRTYNVTRPHAGNVLKAIRELKKEKPGFDMYVMLGAWIDCEHAWTDLPPDHEKESPENAAEISRAIQLAREYDDIVKTIAVGNEAMVHWASSYYVHPKFILKWVRYLQEKKREGVLSPDLWITSSDNFASWGGGGSEYHLPELDSLINEVDFISLHTYPMHDTHYNPDFWGVKAAEQDLPPKQQIDSCMQRALEYAQMQYYSVVDYMRNLGVEKPVHIGETGWASASNGHYGAKGSGACDEYKLGLYYNLIRQWTDQDEISCFYFEAFDETWKDRMNPGGSENHFGLFTVHGQAKYPLWRYVDQGAFKQLSRGGRPIEKTYDGRMDSLFATAIMPPIRSTQQTEMTKE
ncbi:MAG TPA: glycosyl hydrolase family 17 protein [Saprospiraceae bacterium]|nr:glycosyl hydrolase family 17 protein [Saprospiraceae bacterium]